MDFDKDLIRKHRNMLLRFGMFSHLTLEQCASVTESSFSTYCKNKNINTVDGIEQVRLISRNVASLLEGILFNKTFINNLVTIKSFDSKNQLIKTIVPEFCPQAQTILVDAEPNIKKMLFISKNNNTEGMSRKEKLKIGMNFHNTKYKLEFNPTSEVRIGTNEWLEKTKSKITELLIQIKCSFYKNLFIHANDNFEDLEANNGYEGGLTLESKVEIKLKNTIEKQDLLDLIKHLDGYIRDDFVIAMHPTTFNEIKENGLLDSYYSEPYFYKIPVIQTACYPYKRGLDGKWNVDDKPVAIFSKRSVVAYGLDFLVYDIDINKDEKKYESNTRIIKTVGELKLCDPNLYAKYLVFKK